jgi:hypothetical protein
LDETLHWFSVCPCRGGLRLRAGACGSSTGVTGNFFIAMKVPPPSPGYGPFVLATSAPADIPAGTPLQIID